MSGGGSRPRRRSALGASVAAVAAMAAVALTALMPADGSDGRAAAGPPQVDPTTRALIAAFRREQTPADVMPGDPASALRQTGDAQPGEDPSQSRRVDLPGAARPAYLWPMDGGVCHSAPNGGIGCVPSDVIRDLGVVLSVRSNVDPERGTYKFAKVFGIAQDGIEAVTFGFEDGSEQTVEVDDNVLYAEFGDMPTGFSWSDDRGDHSKPMPGRLSNGELSELNGN